MSDTDEKENKPDNESDADKEVDSEPNFPIWVGPLLGICFLIGVALYLVSWWLGIEHTPERVVEKSASLIEEKKFDELRVELAKLEGMPEYRLHQQVLEAAILVGEGKYGDVDPYLQYLPEAPKIRSLGLLNHGIARYHQQRYPEAIDYFEQAVAADASWTIAEIISSEPYSAPRPNCTALSSWL